jgi:hypothetical protein
VIKARKLSSSLSAASAACDHIRDWILGTPKVPSISIFLCFQGYELASKTAAFCTSGYVGVHGRLLRW